MSLPWLVCPFSQALLEALDVFEAKGSEVCFDMGASHGALIIQHKKLLFWLFAFSGGFDGILRFKIVLMLLVPVFGGLAG